MFGGQIRALGDRRWIDTRVGGLRVFVVQRGRVLDIAVFTPETRELDPFLASAHTDEWVLDVLPTLSHGFVFTGCRGGVLYATTVARPGLEDLVAALWELARWAREPWRPLERGDRFERAVRRRVWVDRLLRACVFLVLAWALLGLRC